MGSVIKAGDIAAFLGAELEGQDLVIAGVSSFTSVEEGTLTFTKNTDSELPAGKAVVIVPIGFNERVPEGLTLIRVSNPRLAFAKLVAKFFPASMEYSGIHASAVLGENVHIGKNVTIGPHSVIESGVRIGNDVCIHANVVVYRDCVIGDRTEIKSGSVIGAEGFGLDFEEDGTPVKIPHIGKVLLGEDVLIGALCTIDRGTIDDTVLEHDVKLGQRIHLAHNCRIGKNTVIAASASISGSVHVGNDCWIGASSSIINQSVVEDGALVGFGAVVVKKVEKNSVVVGNPAKFLKNRK